MSRYMGPIHKKSRSLGFSILENNKDLPKEVEKVKGKLQPRKKKLSNYGLQLQEKQKVRFMYGLNERQLLNTFLKAKKMKNVTGFSLLILLESRLDNLVYRLGFAPTRRASRQLVSHGHILVNGKKVDIPSYIALPKDEISLSKNALKISKISESLKSNHGTLGFVKVDVKAFKGVYLSHPLRSELSADINESLIVEWYNRFV